MSKCNICNKEKDLRFGYCLSCAMSGEERSAKRTVIQHLKRAWINFKAKRYEYLGYDLRWAWQRFSRTGDYETGGYFDSEGHDWRNDDSS